jgi:uncharacterized protein
MVALQASGYCNADALSTLHMMTKVRDLHDETAARDALLAINNASARETSLLSREKLDRMIACARVATFIAPDAAFLLGFDQDDDYDGGHFLWFRSRHAKFIYVDRIVVAAPYRRHGFGRALYADLFARAERLGHTHVACEVNAVPPNPTSDAFHAAEGFEQVGTATFDAGAKTVRYLLRLRP